MPAGESMRSYRYDRKAAGGDLTAVRRRDSVSALDLRALKPEQHFTQPPVRYTEATLIKALEENGRKKEYEITELGREAVRREILRLRELLSNGEMITKGWDA